MSELTISTREFELLSTYLDGQLNARESDQLQRALRDRPELRQALQELRNTRQLLRSVPRRRVPRNFTLKPEMVPARRRVFSRPVISLGFASILATIFLVFSVLLEFVPEPVLYSGAPAVPQSMDNSTERTLAQPTSSAEMKAVGSATDAVSATPEPTLALKAPSATRQVAQPITAPTATAEVALQPQLTPLPPADSTQPPQVMLGAPPTAELDRVAGEGVSAPRSDARKTLTWLQTLLVVLAVGTGLAALYLRRK